MQQVCLTFYLCTWLDFKLILTDTEQILTLLLFCVIITFTVNCSLQFIHSLNLLAIKTVTVE